MTEATKNIAKKNLGTAAKIACLCIIMFQYAKAFSTPALGEISAAFTMVDPTMVKQIESIPSLMAIPGAFCVAIFERFMKKRTIVWIAMLCTLVGGIVAGLMPVTLAGFYGILACRVILGFGRGLIFPLASSFIADLFIGKTRDRLMSFKTATGGLAGALFQIIGGALAVLSWRYAFIGYAFIIPIIIMVAIGLPEPDVKPIPVKSGKRQMTASVWVLIILACLWQMFQFSIFTNMALVVKSTGLGDATTSAGILSVFSLVTAAGALCYGAFLKRRLGGYDLAIALILEVIAFWILSNCISISMYYVAIVIMGFGFGMYNPALILQCVRLVPKQSATMTLSLLAALQNLGQYGSAFLLAALAPVFGAGAVYAQLAGWQVTWPMGIIFSIAAIVLITVIRKRNPKLLAGLPQNTNASAYEEEAPAEDVAEDEKKAI